MKKQKPPLEIKKLPYPIRDFSLSQEELIDKINEIIDEVNLLRR